MLSTHVLRAVRSRTSTGTGERCIPRVVKMSFVMEGTTGGLQRHWGIVGTMFMDIVGEVYQNDQNTMRVTVKDADTGEPLNRVLITVTPAQYSASYYTDSEGMVQFTIHASNPSIATVTITATFQRYKDCHKEFNVITGQERTEGLVEGKVEDWHRNGKAHVKIDLFKGIDIDSRLGLLDEGTKPYATVMTDELGHYIFENVSFGGYSVSPGLHQDLRIQGMDFAQVQVQKTDWFKTLDLTVSDNQPLVFGERTGQEYTNLPHKPYGQKVMKEYELTDAGHRFRVWVVDHDGDEPEYVELRIGGKNFTMKPMRTFDDWKNEYGGDVHPSTGLGRYYEVVIKDSELDSGTYNYSFHGRDVWSMYETVEDADGSVEIISLREIFFRDNMMRVGVLGGCCIVLLVIYFIARAKSGTGGLGRSNKELTVAGLGYTLKGLEAGSASNMAGDLKEYRQKYLEGKIEAAELIQKLKGK